MPENDNTCFLRVHNRKKNNDTITRNTYENAIKTKTFSSGLELGKTAFALRVVHPYYDNSKKLIGYMEVGEEIEHFFDIMKHKTGNEFIVAVDKKFLNKKKWNEARKTNKLMKNWNLFDKKIILAQTTNKIDISEFVNDEFPKKGKILETSYKIEDKLYIIGLFPLIDAGNKKVGAIYFFSDITKTYNEQRTKMFRTIVIFIIVLLILCILIIIFLNKIIINPIINATNALKKISEKQINFQINEKREDEIGDLFKSINKININFKEIIINISNSITAMQATGKQINTTSYDISQRAINQANTTDEIVSSMEQILETISSNTGKAEITNKISTKSAKEMISNKKYFTQTINSVSEINDKISIISEISFQTNLLSLNAAIEAANAGRVGKGFGVVANEVRKLADKTKIASEEIEELSNTGKEVSIIAGKKLEVLIKEIIKSAELVNNIVIDSREQKIEVEKINNSILQLTGITNQNSETTKEMYESAGELSAKAEQLKSLISVFKTEN